MTTLSPDKIIEMLVKSVSVSLGLYLSQPLNNNIIVIPHTFCTYCMFSTNNKPVKMLYVDVNKDPVKTPQNLAASLLEVLWERDIFRHGKN